MVQEPALTASKIEELTDYDLTRSLDGIALYCEKPKVRKDGNSYLVSITQVYIQEAVFTEYFTGEMDLIAQADTISWKIEYDEKLSDFIVKETDIDQSSEINVSKTDKDFRHLKLLFLNNYDPQDYIEERNISEDALVDRLKEPFKTLYISEHRAYTGEE